MVKRSPVNVSRCPLRSSAGAPFRSADTAVHVPWRPPALLVVSAASPRALAASNTPMTVTRNPSRMILPSRLVRQIGVESGAQVALAEVGDDDDDELPRALAAARDFHGSPERRAGGDADEEPVLARRAAGHREGIVVLHADDFVVDLRVEHLGNEARADALDGVR